jgi:hypothetical protein
MIGWSVAGNHSIGWKIVRVRTLCAAALLLGSTSCNSGPARIPPVDVNIDAVLTDLMSEFDTDKNGSLSRGELAAMPPLADCLSHCRRNSKDEISVEELAATLRRVFDPRTAVVSASCLVRCNGQPLSGASVRFVPLPMFKSKLPVGSGVTDVDGFAMIAAAPEDLPKAAPKVALITPGFYLVEVTHPAKQIPDKYNRQTVLGREVSTDTVYRGKLGVDLKL